MCRMNKIVTNKEEEMAGGGGREACAKAQQHEIRVWFGKWKVVPGAS